MERERRRARDWRWASRASFCFFFLFFFPFFLSSRAAHLSSLAFILPISTTDAFMKIIRLYSINRELSFTVRVAEALPFFSFNRGRWSRSCREPISRRCSLLFLRFALLLCRSAALGSHPTARLESGERRNWREGGKKSKRLARVACSSNSKKKFASTHVVRPP